jgi:hypothetical protein
MGRTSGGLEEWRYVLGRALWSRKLELLQEAVDDAGRLVV